MRIAFFGGTFDPPHRGHVAIAHAAADAFALDTVFFTPAGRQPLKGDHAQASFADRLTLTALTCGEDPRFAVSNLDAPRPDGEPNYTVRTLGLLHELMSRTGDSVELYAIAGADSFHTLAAWREPQRLLELAQWIVVSRPGFPLTGPGGTVADPEGMLLTAAQRARVHPLDSVHDDVSATELRARLAAGLPSDDLLPLPVARYIAHHGLYRLPA